MSKPDPIFIEHAGHQMACLARENEAATQLPVVWIHGLTASIHVWDAAMYDGVAENRSWYSVGLPLHHPSTFSGELNDETLTEDLFAELIAAQIEHLIPDGKFHLVGHSLGGFAALNYAAKFPDRVASVVPVGGFMRGRAEGLEGMLQFLSKGRFFRKAIFYAGFNFVQAHRSFLKLATFGYARYWRNLREFTELDATIRNIYPDVKNHSIPALRAMCRYLIQMDLFDELDAITAPVLFFVGEKDPIVSSAHQIACARKLKNAKLIVYQECGHLPFAEEAERFEKSLLKWLDRHG